MKKVKLAGVISIPTENSSCCGGRFFADLFQKYILALCLFGSASNLFAQQQEDVENMTRSELRIHLDALEKYGVLDSKTLGEFLVAVSLYSPRVSLVEELLLKGADVNYETEGGMSPLIGAISRGANPDAIEILLAAGADANFRYMIGYTPIHIASMRGPVYVNKLLIAEGHVTRTGKSGVLNLNAQDDKGRSALVHAVKAKNFESVKILIDAGINPNLETTNGSIALHYAALEKEMSEIVITLINAGSDLDSITGNGTNPLLLAAAHSDVETIKVLLNAGADTAVSDSSGKTSFLYAARYRDDPAVLREFIDNGADIYSIDNAGCTALHLAAFSPGSLKVKLLLEAGADLHAITNDGATALIHAARFSDFETVKVLLEAGSLLEVQTNRGYTAFDLAEYNPDPSIRKILLEHGAIVRFWKNESWILSTQQLASGFMRLQPYKLQTLLIAWVAYRLCDDTK